MLSALTIVYISSIIKEILFWIVIIMTKFFIPVLIMVILVSGCNIKEIQNDYEKDTLFLESLRAKTEYKTHHDLYINEMSSDTTVYITKTGECYHKENCRYLHNGFTKISLNDAKTKNYRQCSVCFSDN